MDYEKKYKEANDKVAARFGTNVAKEIFTDLYESEDEKIVDAIRKALESKIEDLGNGVTKTACLAWLEKQGKQKPILDFNADDWYVSKVDGKIHNIYHSVDKVEPKFKVGDWVVSPNGVYWHIDAIQNGRYEVTADTGQCGNWPLDTNIYRLWTIQDAKDGDVLYHKAENGIEYIVMNKGLNEFNNIDSYFRYSSINGFGTDIPSVLSAKCDSITPATKEQRDLLFQKMKEAGYEWDAEKKELKKIEQKSATMSLDEAIEHCKEKSCGNNACALEHKQLEKWLTELKELKEQKPAWSEEDETIISALSQLLKDCELENNWNCVYSNDREVFFVDIVNWLKSLKQRYAWKPSDEQIKVLESLIENRSIQRRHLVSLYEQLKNLKRE